jgi:hypothetical protein
MFQIMKHVKLILKGTHPKGQMGVIKKKKATGKRAN